MPERVRSIPNWDRWRHAGIFARNAGYSPGLLAFPAAN